MYVCMYVCMYVFMYIYISVSLICIYTHSISVRSIGVNSVMELVVLLYLLDNDTSVLVLFTVGGGLAVNVWKVMRAWNLARSHSQKGNTGDQSSKQLSDDEALSRCVFHVCL